MTTPRDQFKAWLKTYADAHIRTDAPDLFALQVREAGADHGLTWEEILAELTAYSKDTLGGIHSRASECLVCNGKGGISDHDGRPARTCSRCGGFGRV